MSTQAAGFSPVRCSSTLAASSALSMRRRTRRAVSGIRCQIGFSTLSTSAVVIWLTGLSCRALA
jgi:hypothetical protein